MFLSDFRKMNVETCGCVSSSRQRNMISLRVNGPFRLENSVKYIKKGII